MKVLILDIETSPIVSYHWGLFDQNIGLNQIKQDWHLLAWSAKWLGDPPSKAMYMDNRNQRLETISDDKALVAGLAKLIHEADVLITQNGDAFDVKKLNARAIINKLPPIKPTRSIDILKEGRKVFKFTSHKLEYITGVLNDRYKKLKHEEYPGFELWSAIMKGDKRAWAVMKKYCIHDVLSTEEAYTKLAPWIKTGRVTDFMVGCKCGSNKLQARGYAISVAGRYARYQCQTCGKWLKSPTNEYTMQQKQDILREGR
jgi:hypothetical protein